MLSQQRFKAQICEKPSLVVAHTLLFLPEIDHGKGWLLAQGPCSASISLLPRLLYVKTD